MTPMSHYMLCTEAIHSSSYSIRIYFSYSLFLLIHYILLPFFIIVIPFFQSLLLFHVFPFATSFLSCIIRIYSLFFPITTYIYFPYISFYHSHISSLHFPHISHSSFFSSPSLTDLTYSSHCLLQFRFLVHYLSISHCPSRCSYFCITPSEPISIIPLFSILFLTSVAFYFITYFASGLSALPETDGTCAT